jgi:hypothetical protein
LTGRSLEHLTDLSKSLQARFVDPVVLDQGIDTSTVLGPPRVTGSRPAR